MSKRKLSIGSWAYIFNQEKPTNDFHQVVHMLHDLGYDGVELGSFGVHPTPVSHPTRASRQRLKKDVADHGLEFSGIAVDLWSFKKPGPSIMDENPVEPATIKLTVNARYPDVVPLTSVPPQVLQTLPKLTEDLEYRFVGDWLILLDTHAHVVADYIDDALPK